MGVRFVEVSFVRQRSLNPILNSMGSQWSWPIRFKTP